MKNNIYSSNKTGIRQRLIFTKSLVIIVLIIFSSCNNKYSSKEEYESKTFEINNDKLDVDKPKILIYEEDFSQGNNENQNDSSNKEYKKLKRKRLLIFDFSDNPDSLGIKADIEVLSIEAIRIHDNYAILSDNAHKNIKKVCLKTGSIKASKTFAGQHEAYFEEIAYFNDLFYVISHYGKIFKFSKDLEFVESFDIDEGIYLKILFDYNPDTLMIFQDPSPYTFLDEDNNLFLRRILIDRHNQISYDTIFVGKGQYSLIKYRIKLKGEAVFENNKLLYSVGNNIYEIPDSIENYNWGRNIDYSEDKLVFFEISREDKKFYLHVYEY